jgi:hypothetical protein
MRKLSSERILARRREGFGCGEGVDYRPWLGAGDVPSRGVTTVFPGRKTGRTHVAFSHLERSAMLTAQWLDEVIDVREQFPLWPLDETLALADKLGVTHPSHSDGTPIVMTTDILLTVRNADPQLQPITVKPDTELNNSRVLERLEIERLYWANRDLKLGIVTGLELPEFLIKNLDWVDEYYDISAETLDPEEIPGLIDYLFDQFSSDSARRLRTVCAEADNRLGHGPGTSLAVVRHALARKLWRVPMDQKLDPGLPLPIPTRAAPRRGR